MKVSAKLTRPMTPRKAKAPYGQPETITNV